MTGPYEGTSLPWPPAGRMRWDSAMALTICAEGLEIMFPSWYCGGISLVFFFSKIVEEKRERAYCKSGE